MTTAPIEPGDRPAVWMLAVGQTLGFAALLYLFPATLPAIEAGTQWPRATLALGPTAALVTAALAAPIMGRLVDAGQGARLLTWGPILGAGAIAALTLTRSPVEWVLLWAVSGLAYAASLYDVCFALLTRRLGPAARAAVTRVTLVAGFASTLAFPAGAVMSEAFGWRGAFVGFAAVQIVATAPLNRLACAWLRRREGLSGVVAEPPDGALRAALARPVFWGLAVVFALTALNHGILVTYALPLFSDRGADPVLAVLAASCVGPAQVAGRVALMLTETRVGLPRATWMTMCGLVLGSGFLIAAEGAPGLIFAYAATQGAAVGVLSILRPVLIADRLGRRGFGGIAGAIAMGAQFAAAGAPVAGSLLQRVGGMGTLLAATFAMATGALVLSALLFGRRR